MDTPPPAASAAPEKDDPTIWRADDALWALLEPVLRVDKPRRKPGRPRRDDRAIFDGLVWPARTGSQWSRLPGEFGPKSTVHRRFAEWVETGALARAWAVLLRAYDGALGIDWEWLAADGCSVKAPFGKRGGAGEAEATGRNPTDRGKPGTKRHLLSEGKGAPVACVLSGANRHDRKKLAALLDAAVVEPAPTAPPHLALDRGYDYPDCRGAAVARGYTAHIPPKATGGRPLPPPGHPDRHPPRRWVVEVGHSWFIRFRRLLVRWEKRAAHYLGFVQLAACLIIYRKVRHARLLSG